jgi:hypothetical protein
MCFRDVIVAAVEVGRLLESAADRPCVNAPPYWDDLTTFEQDLWLDHAEVGAGIGRPSAFPDDPGVRGGRARSS